MVPLPMRLGSVPPLSALIPARLGAGGSPDVAAGIAAVFFITGGAAAFDVATLIGVTVEAEGLDESDEASVFPDRDTVSSVLGVKEVLILEIRTYIQESLHLTIWILMFLTIER